MALIAPDVAPQPIPGVREQSAADATTFGGGPGLAAEGQEVQKIAQSAGDIGAFERIRADQTAVEEAQAKATKLTIDVLHDPQNGVLTSRGKDSQQAQTDGMMRLQKGLNDISEGLHGEQQIGAFNKWALEHVGGVQTHMMTHVDEQLKAHDANSWGTLLHNQSGLVALSHGNPDILASSFKTVNDNAVAFAQRNRLDPDATKEFVQNAHDVMHSAVIEGMLKFQPDDSAQKYFDANKDNISPDAQFKLQKGLEEGNLRWRSASAAQVSIQSNPASEADALKALDKISNPEIQDGARKIVSARFSENRQAAKNDQDALFVKMNELVTQSGKTDPIDRRAVVPPSMWPKLSSEQQRAIEKGGSQEVTSPKVYLSFMQQVKDGTVKDMSQADLQAKYLAYANPADQKEMMGLWSGAKGGKSTQRFMDEQNVQRSIETNLVNEKLIAAKTNLRSTPEHQLMFDVMDNVHREYTATQAALGRNLKPEEVQPIIDRATLKVIASKPVGWFSREPVPFESIPDRAKQSLMMMGRQNGFAVDKVQIERAYKAHLDGKSDDEILKMLKK